MLSVEKAAQLEDKKNRIYAWVLNHLRTKYGTSHMLSTQAAAKAAVEAELALSIYEDGDGWR